MKLKKSTFLFPNNNNLIKKLNPNKKIQINPKFFSIKLFPYNKLLSNLLIYLQKKLTPSLFNEIYKYFINEIKKYYKKETPPNNAIEKITINLNQTENLNINSNKKIISEFCEKNNSENYTKQFLSKNRTKVNLKKYFKRPFIDISYMPNFRNENNSNKEISSFSNNITNKNVSKNISLFDDKDLSYIISKNNHTIEAIGNGNTIKKRLIKNNYFNKNRQSKNKINEIFLDCNSNFNTINTTILKNRKKNFSPIKKIKKLPKQLNKKGKSDFTKLLSTLPNPVKKIEIKNKNKCKTRVNSNVNNLNNAVVINNTFFSKYKNNYNFGLIPNSQKKLKSLKFNLKDKDKKETLRNSIKQTQSSNEMIDKIKRSLDDNLKVMLNFSYENFLSKESERESKEYSIGDQYNI